MPKNQHKGNRIMVTVPEALFEKIKQQAELETVPVATMAKKLIEEAIKLRE